MKQAKRTDGKSVASTHPDYWIGVTADDIPQGWMDDMVKRIFNVLNRELIRVENAQAAEPSKDEKGKPPDNPQMRIQHARSVVALQQALQRLTDMEMQRKILRETKVKADNDLSHEALESVLDGCAAQVEEARDAGASEPRTETKSSEGLDVPGARRTASAAR